MCNIGSLYFVPLLGLLISHWQNSAMSNWKGSMASGHSTLNGQSITYGLPLMLWGLPWWSLPSRRARWIRPCRRPTGCVIRGSRPSQLCPPRRCTTRRIPSHASANARPGKLLQKCSSLRSVNLPRLSNQKSLLNCLAQISASTRLCRFFK